jgi:hypothetical protein
MPTASAGAGDWITTKMKSMFSSSESDGDDIAYRMNRLNDSDMRMTFINNVMRQQEINVIEIEEKNADKYYFVKGDSRATIVAYSEDVDWTLLPNSGKIKNMLDLLETEEITASNMISAWKMYTFMDMEGVPDMQTIIINFVYN